MGGIARIFPPGHFALELDGVSAGYARNIQGGGAVADVIQEKVGADHLVHKHVGAVHYDDIVVTCGAGMSRAFYDWVGQASTLQGARKDGAVIVYDNGNKEVSRLNWYSGLITEIDFPALDARSKDAFSMTIKISPEYTRSVKGGGNQAVLKPHKSLVTSGFRLTIDGLEEACKYVSRIEPIAFVQKLTKVATGASRDYSNELAAAELGNLLITLPESRAKAFYDWFEDFVIRGNSGSANEKNGKLETGPFTLTFGNLGLLKMTRPSAQGASEIFKTKAEMYCESIQFSASS